MQDVSPLPVAEYVPTGHEVHVRELPTGIHFVSGSQPPLFSVHALICLHVVPLPSNPAGHGPHARWSLPKLIQVTSGEQPPLLVLHGFMGTHPVVPLPAKPAGHGPQTGPDIVLVQIVSGSHPPLLVVQKLICMHLPLEFSTYPLGHGLQM